MRIHCTTAAIVALLFSAAVCPAGEISIGYLSFDILIAGAPGSPGVNTFTVGNLTGDPLSGGNDLPPTFPVLTPLTFQNSSLVLWSGGSSQTIQLGDIGPGFLSPFSLEFADTMLFTSADFSATLDSTNLQLDGGGGFTASSDAISAMLLPASGNSLVAGTDFTLIQVAPEPEPFRLILPVTVLFLVWRRRSRILP